MKREDKIIAIVLIVTVAISVFSISLNTLQVWNFLEKDSLISYFGTNETGMIKVYGDQDVCQLITIEGTSMYPSMTSSNTIIAENITNFGINNIVVGDVIVFYRDSHLVCHRVIQINDGSFSTKGDNNAVNDPDPVPFLEVRFVVVAVLR